MKIIDENGRYFLYMAFMFMQKYKSIFCTQLIYPHYFICLFLVMLVQARLINECHAGPRNRKTCQNYVVKSTWLYFFGFPSLISQHTEIDDLLWFIFEKNKLQFQTCRKIFTILDETSMIEFVYLLLFENTYRFFSYSFLHNKVS